jgi:hypothetical protein
VLVAEARAARHDDDVAGHCQLQPAGEAEAAHGGDHGQRTRLDGGEHRAALGEEGGERRRLAPQRPEGV